MSPAPHYQDDLVTLYNGNAVDVLPVLPSGTVITDPPYNVGYHYDEYEDSLGAEEYAKMLLSCITPPCVVIHYAESIVELSMAMGSAPSKVVAWVYPSNTARQWRAVAWWGCRPDFRRDGQDYKNPTDRRIAERIAAGKRARLYDWWEINQVKNVASEKTEHPCQIPVEVMLRIIRITAPALVIDPFAGSGTTLLAAKRLGVPSIGIERSAKYCDIIANRLSAEASL